MPMTEVFNLITEDLQLLVGLQVILETTQILRSCGLEVEEGHLIHKTFLI